MTTATIRLFLVHGDPKRLRTAEISNWTGKAVAGPRTEFEGILGRDESDKSGIYLLTGTDPESGRPAVYIGEAEGIRDRLKAHLEKDFWSQVTFFVSKDENLTKAHIRYLEGKLIEIPKATGRALVTNGQGSGSKLPESDRWEMEVFLEKIAQLLPVLGIEVFVPASGTQTDTGHKDVLFCDLNPASKVFGATYPTPGGDYQSCQKDVAPPNPSNWHDTPLYRDLFEHPRVPTSPPGRMPGTIYPWVPVGNP